MIIELILGIGGYFTFSCILLKVGNYMNNPENESDIELPLMSQKFMLKDENIKI